MTAHHLADKRTTLTASDIQALADRLLSRGVSKLVTDRPESQRDLRAAARVIRALASDLPSGFVVTIDE